MSYLTGRVQNLLKSTRRQRRLPSFFVSAGNPLLTLPGPPLGYVRLYSGGGTVNDVQNVIVLLNWFLQPGNLPIARNVINSGGAFTSSPFGNNCFALAFGETVDVVYVSGAGIAEGYFSFWDVPAEALTPVRLTLSDVGSPLVPNAPAGKALQIAQFFGVSNTSLPAIRPIFHFFNADSIFHSVQLSMGADKLATMIAIPSEGVSTGIAGLEVLVEPTSSLNVRTRDAIATQAPTVFAAYWQAALPG